MSALQTLSQVNCETPLQAVRKQVADAQLCLIAGRAEMAEALLKKIYTDAQNNCLEIWCPQLAVEIIQLRSKALQAMKTSDKQLKEQIAATINNLHQHACQIDIALAAKLIQ